MIRINLLPHREQKRQARIRRFVAFLVVFAVGGLAVVGLGVLANSQRLASQEERNQILRDEIARLDAEIAKIDDLKKKLEELKSRKAAVEKLQRNRSETVHVFDQLVRQTPEGIYLKEVKQENDKLTITGLTQSNARVATFMRALEDSPVFELPNLIEIKIANSTNSAGGQAGIVLSEFKLSVTVTRAAEDDSTKAAARKG